VKTGSSFGSQAQLRALRHLSPIWLVPIIAALVGLWLLYVSLTNQGPLITLYIKDADGIVAGKTMIKALSVDVGTVQSVKMSKDLSHVILTARMAVDTEQMLKQDSQFWVVKPRVGRQGISGLNTLLSGAYIELLPGKAERAAESFKVLDEPPLARAEERGIKVMLYSENNRGLVASDPVIYRGFTVGRVETARFSIEHRRLEYQLFIHAPYDALVTSNVRFWTNNGMRISASSEGISLETGTLESLLRGGVTFDVPEGWPLGRKVKSGEVFNLYADEESSHTQEFLYHQDYVLKFGESIRGLNVGAPVEYLGVRVGTVLQVPFMPDNQVLMEQAPRDVAVLVRLEPGRINGIDSEVALRRMVQVLEDEVKRGLRASLRTGNLLTGGMVVELAYHPDPPRERNPGRFNDYPVLPTAKGGLYNLEQQSLAVLRKINELPVEQTLTKLDDLLSQSRQSVAAIGQLSQTLNRLAGQPATQQLPDETLKAMQQLQQTLAGFSAEAPAYQQLNQTIDNLNRLLNELKPVARTLSEQPNALIFSPNPGQDPQPRRAQ